MKKSVIIPVVVVAILVIGGGAYWFTQRDQTNSTESGTTTQQAASTDTNVFSAQPTANISYEATITLESKPDAQSTVRYDGKGNSEFVSVQNGKTVRVVFANDELYTCQGNTCYKMAKTEAYNPANYTLTQEQINAYKQSAVKKGTAACGDATCTVWEVKQGDSMGTIYVDTATQRVMKAVGVYDGSTGTMVFTYKDVTVEVPKNAQNIPQ